MNLAVKAGIGLLMLLGVGLGVGPYFIGKAGESLYRENLSAYEKIGFKAELTQYQRYWFASEAEYQLTPTEDALIQYPKEYIEFIQSLRVSDQIQHGPLVPFKSSFRLAVLGFSSEFSFVDHLNDQTGASDQAGTFDQAGASDQAREPTDSEVFDPYASQEEQLLWIVRKMREGANGQPLIQYQGTIGFDQKLRASMETPSLEYQDYWGSLAVASTLTSINTDLQFNEVQSSTIWGGMTFEDPEGMTLRVEGLTFEQQVQYRSVMNWGGTLDFNFLPVEFRAEGSDLSWDKLELVFEVATLEDQKQNSKARMRFEGLTIDQYPIQELTGTFAVNNVSLEAYNQVLAVFRQIEQETQGVNEDMAEAMSQRILIEQQQTFVDFMEGIELSMENLSLASEEGQLLASLHIKVGELPGSLLQNPLVMINKLEGTATIEVDKTLIPKEHHPTVDVQVLSGVLQEESGKIRSMLSLDAGLLEVNGLKFPLGAILTQNTAASGTHANPQSGSDVDRELNSEIEQ